ncbi:MAG: acyl-CoA thioesterase [Thiomicrorhabdus sp.]|nr:acyl-CoA thioesterase [Thiomicrorhabdus sp.]
MHWKHPSPFIVEHLVTQDEIDHLNHVNNKVYLQWMEDVAWQHSLSVNIDETLIKKLKKVMAIARHEMNFLRGCYLDEKLHIGTWVSAPVGAKKRYRYFQIIREIDQKTVFTAKSLWICIDLNDYKSTDIPTEMIEPYHTQY